MAKNTQGNIDFKGRVKAAVAAAHIEFQCVELQGQELFTAVNRNGQYGWIHLMDTDGLLVTERPVNAVFDGETPSNLVSLRIGVAIQSEDKTALTKPNPFGKAAVGSAPLGIWVDVKTSAGRQRVRLDRLYILFLIPESINTTDPKKKQDFDTAKRAVENAADANQDCRKLVVPRGVSAAKLQEEMIDSLRGTLRGKGRPPGKD